MTVSLPSTKEDSSTVSRYIRRAQWAVCAFFLANGATVGSWVPHVPDRARELHLNTAQLGVVMLASGLGAVLAMPFAGWLTSRFGSRAVSLTAGCCFPLALVAVVLAPTAVLMAAAFLCFGLTGATMDVAMNSQGIAVEAQLRRRTISLFHAMWSIGAFAGSAVTSALLAHHVRPGWTVAGMAAVVIATLLISTRLMLSRREEGVQERAHALRPQGKLLLLGLLVFAAMVSEGSIADWSAIYLRVARGLGEGVVGYGYAAFAAAMVVGRFTGDRVVARVGEMRALAFGGLTAAGGLLLVLTLHGLPAALLGFALVGVGLANASPVLYRTAGQVPGVAPGAGIATAVGLGYAGLLAGPPVLGFLGKQDGVSRIFVAVIVMCCALSAGSPLVRSVRPRSA